MLKYFILIFICGLSLAHTENYLIKLKADNAGALQRYLEEEGYDVAGANRATGDVSVVTPFPFRIFTEQSDLAQNPELKFNIVSQERTEPFLSFVNKENLADAGSYYGLNETNEALRRLEEEYPQWAKVVNLNQLLGVDKTLEGNETLALQVSLNPGKIEDEPKLLINGQHHARELTTQHAVLDSAEDFLRKAKAGSSSELATLKSASIWFVPVVNPDGLNHVMNTDRMWRKNRAHNQDGTRGVDLNRNYDFKWGSCGLNSHEPKSEVYKGKVANSEPEVRLMHELNDRLHFQYSISYHSYGNEILNPYLCGDLREKEVYYRMRDLLKANLGFGDRPASSSGEDHEYHYNKFGTLAFLVEIGEEFQPPFSTYEKVIRPTVLKVLPTLVTQGLSRTSRVKIVDEDTDAPLQAVLGLEEITFKEGEIRVSDSFGTYYWELPSGTFDLVVSKEGYESAKETIGDGKPSTLVKLKKTRFGLNGLNLLARFFL